MTVDAPAGHLEALADDGDPIPKPSDYATAWEALKAECAALDLGPLPEGTLLQLVPAPDLDKRTVQKAISAGKYKWDMVDRKAEAAGMTRSAFLILAAESFEVERQR